MYKVLVVRNSVLPAHLKCVLDTPEDSVEIGLDSLVNKGLFFSGWVTSSEVATKDITVYVKHNGQKQTSRLSENRPDVVAVMNTNFPSFKSSNECGFSFPTEWSTELCCFGIEVNGFEYDLYNIEIAGQLKVLKGSDDWLFLDLFAEYILQ